MVAAGQIECDINTGDTTWIIVATAFSLMMGPALAFFEAGMLRAKHSLSIITQGPCHLQLFSPGGRGQSSESRRAWMADDKVEMEGTRVGMVYLVAVGESGAVHCLEECACVRLEQRGSCF